MSELKEHDKKKLDAGGGTGELTEFGAEKDAKELAKSGEQGDVNKLVESDEKKNANKLVESGEEKNTVSIKNVIKKIKLYNTATRKLENFKPFSDVVKIYTCGPTVYNFPHIGNYAAYAYWDLLVRCLKMNGYKVFRVLNLTDVGHLTSDGDEGEDKLEKGAAREGKTPYEIADFYAKVYLDNYKKMEFLTADKVARATDYIAEDMEAVDLTRERGFTYETRDGIYYDTSLFPEYADFARLDLSGLKAGARVEFSQEKRNAADFAVWKFIQPGEKHAMRWDYLGRAGYPGWHLECATIIHKELGEPIDIHTGGVDHIPVHHTNEIAECFAAYGHQLSRFWLHCDFITIDGQKISKSLGNTYDLEDLSGRGFLAMDYKMWLLSGHYQGARNFTFESLTAAKNRRENWRKRIAECYQKEKKNSVSEIPAGAPDGINTEKHNNANTEDFSNSGAREFKNNDIMEFNDIDAGEFSENFLKILSCVNNNLNSAEACAVIDNSELSLKDWTLIDKLFGLRLIAETPDIPEETYALIYTRDEAKKAKDFRKSDEIREEITRRGILLRDTPEGAVWYYK